MKIFASIAIALACLIASAAPSHAFGRSRAVQVRVFAGPRAFAGQHGGFGFNRNFAFQGGFNNGFNRSFFRGGFYGVNPALGFNNGFYGSSGLNGLSAGYSGYSAGAYAGPATTLDPQTAALLAQLQAWAAQQQAGCSGTSASAYSYRYGY